MIARFFCRFFCALGWHRWRPQRANLRGRRGEVITVWYERCRDCDVCGGWVDEGDQAGAGDA
jgi:Pyruvate/2-oxoacid:ferredoxin oxidoreductase delta subunit